jgi:hypothetical protein
LAIVTTALADNVYVKSLGQSLANANANLEKAMGRALTSEFTSVLIDKDAVRDSCFVGLRDHCNAFVHSPVKEKAAASVYLTGIIHSVGDTIYRHAYAIETAEINALLAHLTDPQAVEALATIGGTEWVGQLSDAQEDFENAYNDKVNVESAINYTLMSESKKNMTQYLDSLLNYIEGNSAYETATFSPVKVKIEEVITDVIAQARLRISVAARNKKEEQQASTTAK